MANYGPELKGLSALHYDSKCSKVAPGWWWVAYYDYDYDNNDDDDDNEWADDMQ